MILKWIYYGVMLLLTVPLLLWSGIASVFMWDAKYWDAACYGISQVLDIDDKKDQVFIGSKNKF
jgi:hypothetical protein